MDADSSYGGSDTAHDFSSNHFDNSNDTSTHNDTSHHMNSPAHHDTQHQIHSDSNHHTKVMVTQDDQPNNKVITAVHDSAGEPVNHQFYHKNEVTLPVNYDEENKDEIDFQREHTGFKEPHYLSTAKINVSDCPDTHSNLEEMSKNFRSTTNLNAENPECAGKYDDGIDNPAFVSDVGAMKSTFNKEKPYNGDLNASLGKQFSRRLWLKTFCIYWLVCI